MVSNVTAPVCANTRPVTVAPVVSVMDVNARMFPLKTELIPSVAELPDLPEDIAGLGAVDEDNLTNVCGSEGSGGLEDERQHSQCSGRRA